MSDVSFFSVDENNIVQFSLDGIHGAPISGAQEALQLVCWAFFTTPGSCLFAPQDGGGALELKGTNIPGPEQLRLDAAVRVRKTFETVKRAQQPGRPANATVTALELVEAKGDPDNSRFLFKIRIRLQSGNSFTVIIPA